MEKEKEGQVRESGQHHLRWQRGQERGGLKSLGCGSKGIQLLTGSLCCIDGATQQIVREIFHYSVHVIETQGL